MIAQLTGQVDALYDGSCIIDVVGVGYLVQASSRTLSALGLPPATVKVLIETHVREDAIVLYGFADATERDWFKLLTTVQGVGGRVALGILSALSPRELAGAIATGDKASLTRAQGVGPRLAVRLLTELKDKTGTIQSSVGPLAVGPGSSGVIHTSTAASTPADDALSALVNLGYRRADVQQTVTRALERLGNSAPVETLVRDSLRELAQRTAG